MKTVTLDGKRVCSRKICDFYLISPVYLYHGVSGCCVDLVFFIITFYSSIGENVNMAINWKINCGLTPEINVLSAVEASSPYPPVFMIF